MIFQVVKIIFIVFNSILFLTSCGLVNSNFSEINRGSFGMMDRSLNTKSYGYQVVEDHTRNAPTEYIERFEVRPGDCGWSSGWNDCSNDRERSELKEPITRRYTRSGSERWYGWSIYFPEDFINVYPTKLCVGQLHQDQSLVPAWMARVYYRGLSWDFVKYGIYYDLIPIEDLRGKWHKFEIHVKWSRKLDGFMRVWINGKQKVNYKGKTMDAFTVYFKYGIYRTYLSRYKNANKVDEVPGQVVYYSNVKRGKTQESLKPKK